MTNLESGETQAACAVCFPDFIATLAEAIIAAVPEPQPQPEGTGEDDETPLGTSVDNLSDATSPSSTTPNGDSGGLTPETSESPPMGTADEVPATRTTEDVAATTN